MKTLPLHRLIFITCACTLTPLLAEPGEKKPAQLDFEPLSLSITKPSAEAPDGGVNPFNMFGAVASGGFSI